MGGKHFILLILFVLSIMLVSILASLVHVPHYVNTGTVFFIKKKFFLLISTCLSLYTARVPKLKYLHTY